MTEQRLTDAELAALSGHTEGAIGAVRLPLLLPPHDEPIGSASPGWMLVSPSGEESLRRIKAKEFGFASARIAILEESHYLHADACEAYARLFAAAPRLLADLRAARAELAAVTKERHDYEVAAIVEAKLGDEARAENARLQAAMRAALAERKETE